MVSDLFAIFHQPTGAPCGALRGSGVSSPSPGSVNQPVRGQHHLLGLLAESGRHPFVNSQLCSEAHRVRLVPQFIPRRMNVLADTLSRCSQVLGSEWTLCSILTSTPLVSGPSGASGGCISVSSMSEGSTQTASFPSFPPEPPRASPDCVSYIK